MSLTQDGDRQEFKDGELNRGTTKIIVFVEGGLVDEIKATNPDVIEVAYVHDLDKHSQERVLVSTREVDSLTETELLAALKEDAGRRHG